MARPKAKTPTRQVSLRLNEDADVLLDQLAGSKNKRGQYVSELIYQAAHGVGLPVRQEKTFELAALQEQLKSLQQRVSKALEQQGGTGNN